MSATVSNDVNNYFPFYTMSGLTQIIKSPTCIPCSSTSLMENILASFPESISQEDVINVGLSDHLLYYKN